MAAPAALRHGGAGLVSLVVREDKEREVTERLVAMGGKLVRGARPRLAGAAAAGRRPGRRPGAPPRGRRGAARATLSPHAPAYVPPPPPPPQVTVTNVAGEAPNGSAFAITLGAAPELDATNLVVGRVVGGMGEVVARLAALPRSKPRDEWFDKARRGARGAPGAGRGAPAGRGAARPRGGGAGARCARACGGARAAARCCLTPPSPPAGAQPFFEAGKAIGDKRATVAEKYLGRPFKRAIVSGAGLA